MRTGSRGALSGSHPVRLFADEVNRFKKFSAEMPCWEVAYRCRSPNFDLSTTSANGGFQGQTGYSIGRARRRLWVESASSTGREAVADETRTASPRSYYVLRQQYLVHRPLIAPRRTRPNGCNVASNVSASACGHRQHSLHSGLTTAAASPAAPSRERRRPSACSAVVMVMPFAACGCSRTSFGPVATATRNRRQTPPDAHDAY